MSEKFWIAVNGPTCAIYSLPMSNPLVTPTPERLIGFPTLEEAQHAQRICLEEPIDKVRAFVASLVPGVRAGRIRVIQPEHPQPPVSGGSTMWTEDPEVHQIAQESFIKTTGD